jgi:hypothetical protein
MSYITIKKLPIISVPELSGSEYIMVTDDTINGPSSKFTLDSLTEFIAGEFYNNTYTKNEVQTILPKIGFDTTNISSPDVGQVSWNIDENTLDLGLNGATLQLGQEQLIRVRNNTGLSISNGSAVMATGTLGNSGRITVAPANLTQANAKHILGIVTETIHAGEDGFCTTFGKVRGINTTGSIYGEYWVDGDILYAKDSGNGALTKVVPTDTEVKLPIAIVIHAHGAGTLFVRVNSIDENHAKAELALKADKVNITDTEYITGLMRNGKQVYGIEVDGGSMPNETVKDIIFEFNATYTYWVDLQNSYYDNNLLSYPLNYTDDVGGVSSVFLDKENNYIKIITTDDRSSFNCKIVLLYTK